MIGLSLLWGEIEDGGFMKGTRRERVSFESRPFPLQLRLDVKLTLPVFRSLLPLLSGYHPLAFNPKPHARIIWDVSFSPLLPSSSSPSSDDMVFATASRDKTVKIWLRPNLEESAMWAPAKILKFDEGVTSCDFYPALLDGR